MRRLRTLCAAIAVGTLLATPAAAAVPGEMQYQGLLLDSGGSPLTGMVDLVFSLFDAVSGGTQLWTESHADVDVLDGVYEVALGSVTPLTPALLAGGTVYLEIEVDTETLTPRQRLLAVPYALQAENADAVGGLAASFATQIFQHFSFDGGDPPNDDPSEGLTDTDGDGVANFVDADNDGDTLSDVQELAQGSDINLVTPDISGFDPAFGRDDAPISVQVLGTGFEPGLTVAFGSQSPTPTNVTPTSFDVQVGPQPVGPVTVTVTNTNGQQDSDGSFSFLSIRTVFTTSTNYTGNLGGVAGADAKCAARAAAAGLPGTYLAWISDGVTDPASRFTQHTGDYRLPSGALLANGWSDLTDGTLDTAPSENEFGGAALAVVWTNVDANGTTTGTNHCNGYTDATSSFDSGAGVSSQTDADWTESQVAYGCELGARLYCVGQ